MSLASRLMPVVHARRQIAGATTPPAPKQSAAPSWLLKQPLRVRWWLAFSRAKRPVTDIDAERSWLNGLISDRQPHARQFWAGLVKGFDFSTPDAYMRSIYRGKNAVNQWINKPTVTYEEAIASLPLEVCMTKASGGGMGDAIVGLYAACGLAKASGREVLYHARWSDWLAKASYPGVYIVPHEGDYGVDISGGWEGYKQATASASSRLQAYCDNLAKAFGLQPFSGQRPNTPRLLPSADRIAVIAPFTSQWPAREWPAAKFTAVARELSDRGYKVIGIGSPNQKDRLAETFGSITSATWRYGCSPDEISELVLTATLVIGNDSGIVHLGGLLGVPTVAVHAGGLPHHYLFDGAPSVRSVVSTRPLPRVAANEIVLRAIPPDRVLTTIDAISPSPLPV